VLLIIVAKEFPGAAALYMDGKAEASVCWNTLIISLESGLYEVLENPQITKAWNVA